jgi:AbrB family looped-hinge helix DNA binding protein
MKKVKISAKGQISIPAEFRRRYDLNMGDQLIVRETEQGIVLTPLPEHPLLLLRGCLKTKQGKKLTEELMDERKSEREKDK